MSRPRPVSRTEEAADRFRAIFALHHPAVFGYAARRIGRSEAGDAAAEVFAIAWRRMAALPAEPETLPWLYGVARNVVRNHRRAGRRRVRLAARMSSESTQTEAAADAVPTVLAALDRLGESDREILRLAAWEGLAPPQIGAVLGCSANAAAVRLHRARRRLEEAMEDEGS